MNSMTNCFSRTTINPETNPEWFTQGPKSNKTKIPKKYRPITCLSIVHKILTSIATERNYNFLDANNILPSEQRGCEEESNGCKDQLLINKMLLNNSRSCHRNLSVTWIDYRKAFDSVLHIRILRVLQMYKISPTIINFLATNMKEWKSNLCLNYSQGNTVCENIKIKCGIIQGNSLSPPFFVWH